MLIGSVSALINMLANGLASKNPFLQSAYVVAYAICIMVLISIFAYFFGWIERKVIAKAQYRHGPTYVGKFGIFQNLADLVKLIAKQKMVPGNADRVPFILAPIFLVSLTIFMLFLLPFSSSLQATNMGLGMLIIFVLIGFTPLLLFVAAYSSGNKYADVSAQRSVLMLLSYELPMVISIAAVFLLAKTYSISGIINAQSHLWFIALMPIGFVVFFIAMLAELERPPFDLREADSELIAGWLTDISAPYYALSLFLDYSRIFLGSLLIAIIFLGGWEGPALPGIIWLVGKAFIIALATILIRATTVRMRIDRILRFGWVWLMPLSLINLILAYLIMR